MKLKTAYAAMLAVLLAAAGATTATSVYAQSNVQIFGLIDTAIEHVTNVNAAGDSLTRMPNLAGGQLPSRIGFRGKEDLGDGLSAVFILETGFAPDSGGLGLGNRLFGRQAYVGLSDSWGEITLGRTYSMLTWSLYKLDLIGPSQFSTSSIDPYLANARHDNSIAYQGKFGNTMIGATYSLGRDASAAGGPAATNCPGENAGDSQACRNWSAMIRYDTPGWGLVAAYDTYNGGPGAAVPFSPASSAASDSHTHLGGYVVFGDLQIGGGWIHRDNQGNALTPKSDLPYLSAAYYATPVFKIDGEIARMSFKDSSNSTAMAILRGTYYLSKRTSVYAMAGRVKNGGASASSISVGNTIAPGGSQNGVLAGIMHTF